MNITKKIVGVFGIIISCTGIILLALTIVCKSESNWFENVFHNKVYVFLLSVLYLSGIAYLEKYMTTPALFRIGSRTKAFLLLLEIKFGFAFIYLCTFFSLFCIITCVKYTYIHEKTAVEILGIFLRYLMGLVLLSVLAEIFKCSENRYLSGNAYLCTLMIPILEVIVIVPQIWKNTPFRPCFIFSWIFHDGVAGYVVLFMTLILTLLYLFTVSIRKDIL